MKIAFTGGGTAGHAIVNKTLIPFLQEKNCDILYLGSFKGMEKSMMEELHNVKYYGVSTGKLRRYLSFENMLDIFRVFRGFIQSFKILRKEKPNLVYSGGGFVSAPVVWAARLNKIPIIIRETDYSVGLANKLCMPFASKIFVTFPDTKKKLKNKVSVEDGMIVRPSLYNKTLRKEELFNSEKPICLIMGGSLGAKAINEVIWSNLNLITNKYSLIHICGRGNYNKRIKDTDSYKQLEFVSDIGKFYNLADVIVTRCGSNAISEGLLLGKRLVCIPLGNSSSRGEQMQNAKFAVKNGMGTIIASDGLISSDLLDAIDKVLAQEEKLSYKISKMELIHRINEHVQKIYDIGSK